MKAKILLPLILLLAICTLTLNAANWQIDYNIHENLIVDEIINLEEDIIIISHYALPPDTLLQDAPTIYKYNLAKFDELGNQLLTSSFESALFYKGYTFNAENEIVTFWQDFYPLIIENGLHVYSLNSDLNFSFEKSIRFNDLSNFNSFYFYNNSYYATGNSQITGLVSLLSFDNQFELNWYKEFGDYQVVSYGSLPEVTANQNGVHLMYNTNELPLVLNGFLDYSSVLIQLTEDGNINWSKNFHYDPYFWSYFGSQLHQFVKTTDTYVWTIGTVSPGCDEGCPYNVLNQIDASGNVIAAKRIEASFYGNLNQGFTLSNGNIVIHGTTSDDIFGGGQVFVKSLLVEFNNELQIEKSFKANEVSDIYLGEQYSSVFPNIIAVANEEVVFYWESKIYRTSLSINDCSNIAEDQIFISDEQDWIENIVEYDQTDLITNVNSLSEFIQSSDFLNHQRTCISNEDTVNAILNIDDLFFTVQPNPVQNQIIIKGELPKDFKVNIYDTNGQILLSAKNQSNIFIESKIKKGVFILELSYKGKNYYKKLLKQ